MYFLDPGDSDDLLDEKYTDINGEFILDGTTRELTNIEPELRIFHDCNDDIRVKFYFPKNFILLACQFFLYYTYFILI